MLITARGIGELMGQFVIASAGRPEFAASNLRSSCLARSTVHLLRVLPMLLNGLRIHTPIALGSTHGAVHGAIAVVLALCGREESGRRDVIGVPLVVKNAPDQRLLQ